MKFFNLHTHAASGEANMAELINQYPLEFRDDFPVYSIGIHPWKINVETLELELEITKDKLNDDNCWAIGECGLDKRIDTPLDVQLEVFARQIRLADEHQKPMVIHCVAAYQELVAIKKQLQVKVPMIVHGFSKSAETAKQLTDNGFYLSFGKYLLRNPGLSEVLTTVDTSRIFLETDTIDEPLQSVYAVAASALSLSVDGVKQIVLQNARTVFGDRRELR